MSSEVQVFKNKKARFLHYLEEARGNVSIAALNANIHRSSHYRWIDEDEEYKKTVDDIAEHALDFVESKLFTLINGFAVKAKDGKTVYNRAPDTAAIIFYLKTRGKHRGYVERHEFVNHDIEVIIEDED